MSKYTFKKYWLLLLVAIFAVGSLNQVRAQSLPPGTADEKSEAVIKRAIELLGGDKYLHVNTMVSNGNFTAFAEGQAGTFYSFNDFVLYPDRERVEFKTNGVRTVQTNTGQTGWLFDGQIKAIRDMKPAQVQDFQWYTLRISLENLLRGAWRAEGATVKHLGRRPAGLGTRNDALRLLYPDGFIAEFEFTSDGFPAKVLYTRKNSDGEDAKEEDRLAQWVDIDGIHTPFIIDHFRAGIQQSRVNYKTVVFNQPIAESFFARPSSAKEFK